MATRDYKNAGRSRNSSPSRQPARPSGKGGGGIGAGILIGLIIGVGVAVAIAFYLNRASSPFADKVKPREQVAQAPRPTPETLEPGTTQRSAPDVSVAAPTAPAEGPVSLPPPDTPRHGSTPAAKPAEPEKPDYDFYQILAGKSEALNVDKPAASDKSKAGKKMFFQLGAFASETEADNLKARLALTGIEASISSINVPDKGLLHRVRVGPYSKPEDIDRVKALLKNEGLSPVMVRADG